MWNKIYLIALAIAVVITGFFTFYAYSWLGSITNPRNVVENFEYYSNLSWTSVWLSSIILLVIANAVFWKTRRSLTMWLTYGFFALFVILQTFLLSQSFFHYKADNGLSEGGFSISPFIGVILCIIAGIIVFFDQFLVLRMNEKMYPAAETDQVNVEAETVEPSDDEEK